MAFSERDICVEQPFLTTMMNATKPYLQKVAPPFLLDDAVYDTLADAPPLEREPPSPLRAFVVGLQRSLLITPHSRLDVR